MLPESATYYVAGHRGMVGAAIHRALQAKGFSNILGKSSKELDLRNPQAVQDFFAAHKPDYVFMAAAKVGGIGANMSEPGSFIYDNLQIQNNIMEAARIHGTKKLLFLGSSCIYPKLAPQPLKEEYLLTGPLEPTNEPYAVAKLAGITMAKAYRKQYGCSYISTLPCNIYGTGDNYHPFNSHVVGALIRKFVTAVEQNTQEVEIWGTGSPLREFLHCDDLAAACLHLMEHYDGEDPVNIGSGTDLSIRDLAETIAELSGFKGTLTFNDQYPDGTPRKLLDISRLKSTGWNQAISLREGLAKSMEEFKAIYATETA